MFTSGRKIKIKKGSNYGKVLSHCKRCIKIKGEEIKMEATGSAIEKLINITEDLKMFIPGLHQNNYISSLYKNITNVTPLFQITLSLNPIKNKTKYGSQTPINESERKNFKRIYSLTHSTGFRRIRRGINRRGIMRRVRGRIIRGMRGMRGGRGISEMRGMRGGRGGSGMRQSSENEDDLGLSSLF